MAGGVEGGAGADEGEKGIDEDRPVVRIRVTGFFVFPMLELLADSESSKRHGWEEMMLWALRYMA